MARRQMVFHRGEWRTSRSGLLESQKTERRQFRKTPEKLSGLRQNLWRPGRQENNCGRQLLTNMEIDNTLGKAGDDSPFSRAALINRPSQNKFPLQEVWGLGWKSFSRLFNYATNEHFSSPLASPQTCSAGCSCECSVLFDSGVKGKTRAQWKSPKAFSAALPITRDKVETLCRENFASIWSSAIQEQARTHHRSCIVPKKRKKKPNQAKAAKNTKNKSRKEENHFHEISFWKEQKFFLLFIRQTPMKLVLFSVVLWTLKSPNTKQEKERIKVVNHLCVLGCLQVAKEKASGKDNWCERELHELRSDRKSIAEGF